MIRIDQIPDEAWKATGLPELAARAAISAALNAWPGAFNAVQTEDEKVGSEADGETPTCFVLPLPQEPRDE